MKGGVKQMSYEREITQVSREVSASQAFRDKHTCPEQAAGAQADGDCEPKLLLLRITLGFHCLIPIPLRHTYIFSLLTLEIKASLSITILIGSEEDQNTLKQSKVLLFSNHNKVLKQKVKNLKGRLDFLY